MKKIYIFLAAMLPGYAASGQCSVTVTGSTNATCFGSCNGSATVTTIGTPTFTYSWSPGGQTVQNPNNLCAGTHTVTMTDANSCVATATVTITQPQQLQDSMGVTHVTCNGDCDGSIDLTPSGGTTPYTYSWSPGGETTQDVNSLCPGTYTVTITDGNSCTTTDSAVVTEPGVLLVGVTSDNGCGAACDKTATATPTGGTAPFSYAWTPGSQTTQTATGLCAGTFQVIVTDTNGCTANGAITITNPGALSVSASGTNASCSNCPDGSATATPAGGTSPFTYAWSPGGCTTASCNGLVPGTYVVTVTDANGCMSSDSVTVGYNVGISEMTFSGEVTVYPNPAITYFILTIKPGSLKTIDVSLVNVIGETLLKERITTTGISKNFSVEHLSKGIYFLILDSGTEKLSQKIIRQ